MTRQLELVVQGVLGTTPIVSRAPSGRAYCRFRLATTPTFRTSEGWRDEETIWFTAKAWGPLAENLARLLHRARPTRPAHPWQHWFYTSAPGAQAWWKWWNPASPRTVAAH